MIKATGNSGVNKSAFILMDLGFASELRAFGISQEVISALRTAMIHMNFGMDQIGYDYARGMRQALIEYGLDGVKNQTAGMVKRMSAWKGTDANRCKRLLRKWSK